jgi:ribosomal protein S18 acetylase RimI-like enzyme
VTSPSLNRSDDPSYLSDLPGGWSVGTPDESDAAELTALLRRHEKRARGWASAGEDDVLVEISEAGAAVRQNIALKDPAGAIRAWGSAHDRAAGRMLLSVVVDPRLDDAIADRVAEVLLEWADEAATHVGAERDLDVQQIDSGAFADDDRQHRWLRKAGYRQVRRWLQMSRPVSPDEADLDPAPDEGVTIRRVEREGSGMPEENDLRSVHDILETAFADHFNSHEETFDEFLFRLREDPGHRWDHWWLAELVEEGKEPEAAGTLVGTVSEGGVSESGERKPDGSYVAYIGVLQSARGRGVAKALLNTIIADAAARGRDRVGLEVDADSPTGADGLYKSMGWETSYVTQSWHRDVPVKD